MTLEYLKFSRENFRGLLEICENRKKFSPLETFVVSMVFQLTLPKHSILFHTIVMQGCGKLLNWVKNFIVGRKQNVVLNNHESKWSDLFIYQYCETSIMKIIHR